MAMIVYKNAWPRQEIFQEIRERGGIDEKEMYRTFNMGIGMVLVVRDSLKMDVARELSKLGVKSYIVGEVVSGVGDVAIV
jgi:phosphoribosylformylglycinamidine cyclo-ligase